MKKAIVVFTNQISLNNLKINKTVPLPKKIIVDKSISFFLLDDGTSEPVLRFSDKFDALYVVFHTGGKTNKVFVRKQFGEKLKGELTLSHIIHSGHYYDKQIREVLKYVDKNSPADKPWTLKKDVNLAKFKKSILEPFDDHGFEKKYAVLYKLLTGEFSLTDDEKDLLNGKNFDMEAYKNSFDKKSPDWEMFDKLREQLFKDL